MTPNGFYGDLRLRNKPAVDFRAPRFKNLIYVRVLSVKRSTDHVPARFPSGFVASIGLQPKKISRAALSIKKDNSK